jgi:hypothetical protein
MGYFKLERGWSDHIVFDNEPLTQREAWVWLIEHAAWRDTVMSVGRDRYKVERGQLAASVRYLATCWQWSKDRAHRFITKLRDEQMIATDDKTHATVITICNYAKYQSGDDDGETTTATAPRQHRDSTATASATASATVEKSATHGTDGNSSITASNPATAGETPTAGCVAENRDKEEEYKNKEEEKKEEVSAAIADWQSLCEESGLSKIAKLTKTRRTHLKARLADCGGLDGWRSALAKIRGSPFMLGKNDRGWKIDFDFLVSESGFTKLMEGKYDGGSRVQGAKSGAATGFAALLNDPDIGRGFGSLEETGEHLGGDVEIGKSAPARSRTAAPPG